MFWDIQAAANAIWEDFDSRWRCADSGGVGYVVYCDVCVRLSEATRESANFNVQLVGGHFHSVLARRTGSHALSSCGRDSRDGGREKIWEIVVTIV